MGKNFNVSPISAQIQKRKIFLKRDIFVYLCLLILILSLFLALTVFNKKSANGFEITVDGKTLLIHSYGDKFDVADEFKENVSIIKDGDCYIIRIESSDGFNLVLSNEKEQSVKMQDSDCPSRNCVHMQKITNAGAIYCAPRAIKILPLGDEAFQAPTTGGAS